MKSTQDQIDEMNQKLDTLLDYVNEQRLRTNSIDDLVNDLSIVGKDAYDTTVAELNNAAINFDPDEVKILLLKLVKNVGRFNQLMELLESGMDLTKDLLPIVNEVTVDFIHKLAEFEEKGYFEFFQESFKIIDNIVTHFGKEDVSLLADNVVTILETVKTMTQPDMMLAANNAIQMFSAVDTENVPEYSLFKLMREMRSPEMKKALGFSITLMKNLSQTNLTSKK